MPPKQNRKKTQKKVGDYNVDLLKSSIAWVLNGELTRKEAAKSLDCPYTTFSDWISMLLDENSHVNTVDQLLELKVGKRAKKNELMEATRLLEDEEERPVERDKIKKVAHIPKVHNFLNEIAEEIELSNNSHDEELDDEEEQEERDCALFFASIDAGNLITVKNLLDDVNCKVNIETIDDNGQTGLIRAARAGQEEIVRFLIDRGSDVEAEDDDGWCALLNACRNGYVEIVSALIDAGANVEQTDLWGWNGANWAAYKNRPPVLKMMIENGVNVNVVDEDCMTALMYACGRGYNEAAILLIEAGANISITDKYGNTPLLWACRKSSVAAAKLLLERGADIYAVGMDSTTPLIMAVKNNGPEIVDEILKRQPSNVNAVDANGMSALSHAARNGYGEMAYGILETGQATVNLPDKSGDTILIYATRAGHSDLVNLLLQHGADFNVKDNDGRSPMHISVEKNYIDIVLVLLEYKPTLEARTNDGDTCLIRAVKKKNALVAQLLVRAGAKVSAATPNGDNCLHIALRARSKRLTQLLLAKPNDARLLYRPNNDGETPYSIDKGFVEPILPHIFGPVESKAQAESLMGYDIYSNVLADILCEPNLNLPMSIGLYAKWGSGKSFLLNKMKESMILFSRSWLQEVELAFSVAIIPIILFFGCLISLCVYVPVMAVEVDWLYPLLTGLLVDVVLFGSYAFIYYGSQVKEWPKFYTIGFTLAQLLARLRLLWCVLFYHPPTLHEKEQLACPVSFLFADYHRLSSVGGEEALAKIVFNLHEALEGHFGKVTTRLWFASRPSMAPGRKKRLRRFCGVPLLLATLLLLASLLICMYLFIFYYHRKEDLKVKLHELETNSANFTSIQPWQVELAESRATASLITASVLLAFTVLLGFYPVFSMLRNIFSSAPRRHLKEAGANLDRIKFEGFMERLQQEVTAMASLVQCMDSFTNSQTRLVIFVDGLDNCEQERMVQTLDALELLFCARHDQPYVVIIAVDPHIIISAINHNIRSALVGTELTGHDYLKNIIHMQFYLQNAALRHLMEKLRHREESLEQWKHKFMRSETIYGSYLSLAPGGETADMKTIFGRVRRGMSQSQVNTPSAVGAAATVNHVVRDDYFSNINPRSIKRIVNTLNLTGRLMRAFEVEFSWLMLGQWIALVEQWPYRMSWIIDFCEENPEISDSTPIKAIYDRIKVALPVVRSEDPLMDIDRNPHNLEMYLKTPSERGLNVGHMRSFVPCTSNLDPYIRKLIKERRMATEITPSHQTFVRLNSSTATDNGFFNSAPVLGNVAPTNLNTNLQTIRSLNNSLSVSTGPQPLNQQPILVGSGLPPDVAQYLLDDETVWMRLKRLSAMTPQDVSAAVKHLAIPDNMKPIYEQRIIESNLSGLVLSVCDLAVVRDELKMSLGDFTLFRLLIETLRQKQLVNVPEIENLKSPRNMISSMTQFSPQESPLAQKGQDGGVRKRANFASLGKAKSIEQKEAEAQMEWLENKVGHLDKENFKGDLDQQPLGFADVFVHRGSYAGSISSNCSKHGSVRFMDTAIEIEDERLIQSRKSSRVASPQNSRKSSRIASVQNSPRTEVMQDTWDFTSTSTPKPSDWYIDTTEVEEVVEEPPPESESDSSGDSNESLFGESNGDREDDDDDMKEPLTNSATSARLKDAVRHLDRQLSTYSLHKKVPAVTQEDEEEALRSQNRLDSQTDSSGSRGPSLPLPSLHEISEPPSPAAQSPFQGSPSFRHARNASGNSIKDKVRTLVDTVIRRQDSIQREQMHQTVMNRDESASDPDSLSTYSEEHQLTIKKRPEAGFSARPSILPSLACQKALSDPSINAFISEQYNNIDQQSSSTKSDNDNKV